MKTLTCELCSEKEFVKEGDFFVCRSCGTKYSSEDAKKLMVEVDDIPDSSSQNESMGLPEGAVHCVECNAIIPAISTLCPQCGRPVNRQENSAPKAKPAPSKKKLIIIGSISAVLVALVIVIVSVVTSNIRKNEYIQKVSRASEIMLDGAVDAEKAGNLIKNVWYNAIYEKRDTETDKFTRPYGVFVDDFNDALNRLFADSEFNVLITNIKYNTQEVNSLMKDLKNPPEEHREAYNALKEFYNAYLELTNLAVNPTGSLNSFSSSFHNADTAAVNCYKSMKMYFD